MKTKHLIALASALTLCTAGAQAADLYVGGGVGPSHANISCDDASSCDVNDTAVNVYGGFGLGNGLSIEIGFISYGEAKLKYPGLVPVKFEISGPKLGIAYQAALSGNWGANFRLGIVSLETKLSASQNGVSASMSETKTTPYFGVGATYDITRNLKLEGGAEFSNMEFGGSKGAVRALLIGARYAF